jgi:hypothetical protein
MTEDMTGPSPVSVTAADPAQRDTLHRVFDAARRFIACRERAAAVAMGRIPPPRTLGEAIERDFLGFDLEEAERALREAVTTADPLFALLLTAESASFAGLDQGRPRVR